MNMRKVSTLLMLSGVVAVTAKAQVTVTTLHGSSMAEAMKSIISTKDLINGKVPGNGMTVEQALKMSPSDPGGFHSINQFADDQWAAFTDGGSTEKGVFAYGLLADNYDGGQYAGASGRPISRFVYDLDTPQNIAEIRVFSYNNDQDGRIYHTYTVEFSTNGTTYTTPIYVQSDPSGSLNANNSVSDPNFNITHYRWTISELFNNGGNLATNARYVRITFYSSNSGFGTPVPGTGIMKDPFGADTTTTYVEVNPFTGINDGQTAPDGSPLIAEIDVFSERPLLGDINEDGCVDDIDLFALTQDFLSAPGSASGNFRTDLNGDGNVDDFDLFDLTNHFLEGC